MRQYLQRGEQLGLSDYLRFIGPATYSRILLLLGKYEAIAEMPVPAGMQDVLFALARGEHLVTASHPLFDSYLSSSDPDDEISILDEMGILEWALLVRNKHVARRVLSRYPVPHVVTSGSVGGLFALGMVQRLLGDAALLLDDSESALRHYLQGIEDANRMHHRPEAALAHLGLANALSLSAPSRDEAQEHLDFAISELRAMKMRPGLERALRLQEELRANSARRSHVPYGLSAREVEILSLIAVGKSSRLIAAELILSVHTVNRHVANIFDKTGSATRAEAVGFAARLGLISSRRGSQTLTASAREGVRDSLFEH